MKDFDTEDTEKTEVAEETRLQALLRVLRVSVPFVSRLLHTPEVQKGAVLAPIGLLLLGCQVPGSARIVVDTTALHQTMTGWEATAWAGQERAAFTQYRDTLLALGAHDLGINRLRLEVRSGVEHRRDYWTEGRAGRLSGDDYRCARYETLNDNDDPRSIDTAGFQFTELENTVERIVLPMQRLVAARGGRLAVNANYVSFFRQCPHGRRYDHINAEEYAEFVLATMLHLRGKYGLVPDTWEVILEPDNTDGWSSAVIGRAIVATQARLAENGFAIKFIAPSTTAAEAAPRYYDGIRTVPGAAEHIGELAYHRYRWVTEGMLREIGARGRTYRVQTAMLEQIGADVDALLDDLTIANVSAWSQFALASMGEEDTGAGYYAVVPAGSGFVVREQSRTPFLRQVFSAATLGAVRIGATSDASGVRAVAFRNPDDGVGVAVRTSTARTVLVHGIPQGRYAVTFATRDSTRGQRPDVTATSGAVEVRMPDAGVLTLRRR